MDRKWIEKKELEYLKAIKENEFYSAHECLDLLREIKRLRSVVGGRTFKL